ncbi:amidase domain-containing protein [Mycoplasma sp. P36-A1]|uniref:amidase domain-containing protein n=1 Tax=Mycoplasma sp. P36-A1 TaxID=3252900 RepID=UPI003C2C61D5
MNRKQTFYTKGSNVREYERTYKWEKKGTVDTKYLLQTYTTRYRQDKTVDYKLDYNGNTKATNHRENSSNYDASGKYYIYTTTYTQDSKNVNKQRKYWAGKDPNYVTNVANFNSEGTNWLNNTEYQNYKNNIKSMYRTYKGTNPNILLASTIYNTKGVKTEYRTYEQQVDGSLKTLTNYYDNGKVKEDIMYIGNSDNRIRSYYIKYYDNGRKEKEINYSKYGTYLRVRTYYNTTANNISSDLNNTGAEVNTKLNETLYDNNGKKTTFIKYKNDQIDTKTSCSAEGKIINIYYYNTNNKVYKKDYYNQDENYLEKSELYNTKSILIEALYFDKSGIKIKLEQYNTNNSKKILEISYMNNQIDKVKRIDENSNILWLSSYQNNKKDKLEVYKYDKNTLTSTEKFQFTDSDLLIENQAEAAEPAYDDEYLSESDFDNFVADNHLENTVDTYEVEPITEVTTFHDLKNIDLNKIINNTTVNKYIKDSYFKDYTNIFYEDLYTVDNLILNNTNDNETLSMSDITKLKGLKSIDLNNINIFEIDSSIENLMYLNNLKLNNCNLNYIADNINNLTKLKTINLANNALTDIKLTDNFINQLQSLNLSNNNISYLDNLLYKAFLAKKDINISQNNFTDTNIDPTELSTTSFKTFIGNQHYEDTRINSFKLKDKTLNDILPSIFINEDNTINISKLNDYQISYFKVTSDNLSKIDEYNYLYDYNSLIEELKNDNIDITKLENIDNSSKIKIDNNNIEQELTNIIKDEGIYVLSFKNNSELYQQSFNTINLYTYSDLNNKLQEVSSDCNHSMYGEVVSGDTLTLNDNTKVTDYCHFKNNEEALLKFNNQNSEYLSKLNIDVTNNDPEKLNNLYSVAYDEYINSNNFTTQELKDIELKNNEVSTFFDIYENKKVDSEIKELTDAYNHNIEINNVVENTDILQEISSIVPDNEQNNNSDSIIYKANKYNINEAVKFAKRNGNVWYRENVKVEKYDCTNFVSYVLNRGGKIKQEVNGSRNMGWWVKSKRKIIRKGGSKIYKYSYTKSVSWINANTFVHYWSTKKQSKNFVKNFKWNNIENYAKEGNVIAYDSGRDGGWDHVAYIVAKNKKKGYLTIAQHTNNYIGDATKKGKARGWLNIARTHNFKIIKF